MSDTPRYIISTELHEYLRRVYMSTHTSVTASNWSKFIEQQNLGVAIPSGSTLKYINAAFQVVDPKQFLMTSIRLGLHYEDVPTTPIQVQ